MSIRGTDVLHFVKHRYYLEGVNFSIIYKPCKDQCSVKYEDSVNYEVLSDKRVTHLAGCAEFESARSSLKLKLSQFGC